MALAVPNRKERRREGGERGRCKKIDEQKGVNIDEPLRSA